MQTLGVDGQQAIDRLSILAPGLLGRHVMRHVAADDRQDVVSLILDRRRQGAPQAEQGTEVHRPDADRHEPNRAHEVLQERDLHFQGVLLAVRPGIDTGLRAAVEDGACQGRVDRSATQGSLPVPLVVHRDRLSDARVVRAEDDGTPRQAHRPVRRARHPSRIDVSRVRHEECDPPWPGLRRRPLRERGKVAPQGLRIGRIELTGDGGPADHLGFRCSPRSGKRRSCYQMNGPNSRKWDTCIVSRTRLCYDSRLHRNRIREGGGHGAAASGGPIGRPPAGRRSADRACARRSEGQCVPARRLVPQGAAARR